MEASAWIAFLRDLFEFLLRDHYFRRIQFEASKFGANISIGGEMPRDI